MPPIGIPYNPANWYWIVGGSTTQVFSSVVGNYVPVTDATYVAWLASGGKPTPIDTEQNLYQVLVNAGVDPGVLTNSVNVSVPSTVMWAFHAALAAYAGGDKETVYDSWITTNKATRLNLFFQWKNGKTVLRNSNLVGSVVTQTGLTPQQMNGIFSDAVTRWKNAGVD